MILEVWGTAVLLVVASLLVGDALRVLRVRCGAAGPAVGLAVLIVVADIALKLPGRATTAAIVGALLLIVAAALVVRDRLHSTAAGFGSLVTPAVAGGVAAVGAAVPFIANGRVGLPGVSLDNDTALHLVWSEMLRSPTVATRYGGLPDGYPFGPHSLVAVLGTGLGVRLDLAVTGLLVATVIITALVACAALAREAAFKQIVVGVLAALLYLVAAYYAEGAFKETLLGLFLLGLVLYLEDVRDRWPADDRGRWSTLIPVAVLVVGGIYVYSYPALAWFGLTIGIWLVAEGARGRHRRRRWRAVLDRAALPGGVAIAVLLVLLAPNAGRIFDFAGMVGLSPSATGAISTTNLGNLVHPLSPYEALGIWNTPDFRFVPPNVFHAGELSAFALAVLLIGLAWSLSRRELLLSAAVAACAIVYWRASHGQSPYVTAKALVIPGPLVAVVGMRGLLASPSRLVPGWVPPLRLLLAAAFVVLALHSSYQVLRSEPVWPDESTAELFSLGKQTRGQTLLFLGASDYAPWIFAHSVMSALAPNTISEEQAGSNPQKPVVYGNALDFDSVSPATINRFNWVITSNTSYASAAPTGFRLVRRLAMYELWQRVARVAPRQVIESPGVPGAVLDCSTRTGRALSKRPGVAAVMPTPVTAPLAPTAAGGVDTATLQLPTGRWDLSLQYVSAVSLDATAQGRDGTCRPTWTGPVRSSRLARWCRRGRRSRLACTRIGRRR